MHINTCLLCSTIGFCDAVSSDAVKRKILVLDLDETLIHSHHDGVSRTTVRPSTPPDFILRVRHAIPLCADLESAKLMLHTLRAASKYFSTALIFLLYHV